MKTLKILGLAFIVNQAIDGFFTMWATNNGYTEANPLVAGIADTWINPVLVKIIPSIIIIWLMVKLVNRFPITRIPFIVGLVAVNIFYIGVTVSNVGEVI